MYCLVSVRNVRNLSTSSQAPEQTLYLVTGYHREHSYSPELQIMMNKSNVATASEADFFGSFSLQKRTDIANSVVFCMTLNNVQVLVTVAEQCRAWSVFSRSDAVIVRSNPTQDMDVWCVNVFMLCLYFAVFR
jgi:hypothetical protein